jgi:2-keto-3-deoxy-L-rhamnonate aldolase RhmA
MIETPEQMQSLREYARFAPAGSRGFFSVSRAINYSIPSSAVAQQQCLNQDLCLMAQIESSDALERVDELAAVPDVDLFIGPADLAASLGLPSQTSHPTVRAAAAKIVKAARKHNKCVATACAPDEFAFWLELGVDLLFCANDISCLKQAAGDSLGEARKILERLNGHEATASVVRRA